jgi:hypothetical protein
MNRKVLVILGAALLLVAATACNLTSLIPGGGSANTVTTLWSDVPPFEGAAREAIEMPLPIRVAMQAMMQGQLEFVVYTTSATADAVRGFYTKDRMVAAGWDPEKSAGCGTTTEGSDATPQAEMQNMCFFAKQEGTKEIALVILMAQDTKTNKTQVFYVRISGVPTPTPASK